jgi:predicted metal-dependent peptidase
MSIEDLQKTRVGDGITNLPVVPLDPKYNKAWDETRAAFLWVCPGLTSVIYEMMTDAKGEIASWVTDASVCPIAATDGVRLILNPDTFFKYKLFERVFIVAHEVMHCIADHCGQGWLHQQRGEIGLLNGKRVPYIPMLANVAQDYIINDTLIKSKIGTFNTDWLHDTNAGTWQDSWVDVYGKLYEDANAKGKIKGVQFDVHMAPGTSQGKDPGQANQNRSKSQWQTAVAGAMATARAQGKLPEAMERFMKEMLEPSVTWAEHIRALLARKIGGGSYDWAKPDRRFISRNPRIITPARSGYGCNTIVVAIDTSGSIGDKELCQFKAEMSGMLNDLKPRQLIILWCDAKIHHVDYLTDAEELREVKPYGGGGTSFKPPFEWMEKEGINPDSMVYLTDGYGDFPATAPRFPVIWGDIAGNKYPWGEVVPVKIK